MPRKSIPAIPVGELRFHGVHSVFRISLRFNKFFSPRPTEPPFSLCHQKNKSAMRYRAKPAASLVRHAPTATLLYGSFWIFFSNSGANALRSVVSNRTTDQERAPGGCAFESHAFRASAGAPVTRHPFAVSKAVTCFSCCSKLRFAKD